MIKPGIVVALEKKTYLFFCVSPARMKGNKYADNIKKNQTKQVCLLLIYYVNKINSSSRYWRTYLVYLFIIILSEYIWYHCSISRNFFRVVLSFQYRRAQVSIVLLVFLFFIIQVHGRVYKHLGFYDLLL